MIVESRPICVWKSVPYLEKEYMCVYVYIYIYYKDSEPDYSEKTETFFFSAGSHTPGWVCETVQRRH